MQFTHDPQPPISTGPVPCFLLEPLGIHADVYFVSDCKPRQIRLNFGSHDANTHSLNWYNLTPSHARTLARALIDAAHYADTLASDAAAAAAAFTQEVAE